MSTFLTALIPLLIVFAVFFAIYRSVRGKKSTKLKSIGWLELLIAYLCVIVPIGLIMGLGKISPVFEKVPGLNPLGTFDFLTRLVLILASFYGGVCLWKTSKAAVKKAKIILVALLVFNVFVVKGVYSLAIYAALASAEVSIPARAVLDALYEGYNRIHCHSRGCSIVVHLSEQITKSKRNIRHPGSGSARTA